MRENLTELVFILDRSGSMASMADEAIGGFNSFLEDQKKDENESRLTLVLFDHEYTVVHDGKDVNSVEPLCKDTYCPRGTTALLDAVGRAIDDVGKRLANTPEEDRPGKVLVAVLTDGLENASNDYNKTKLGEMVSHQRDKYSWEFLFLAANQDAFSEGTGMGFAGNLTMSYDSHTAGGFKKAFNSLRSATKIYKSCASIKNVSLKDLEDDDLDQDA